MTFAPLLFLLVTAAAALAAPPGMVWIPGGTFTMGEESMPDAQPVHPVWVDGFWIDATEVTNAEFARFVDATGYVTIAERPLDPAEFPGVPPEALQPGAVVFAPPKSAVDLGNHLQWWSYVPGANWRQPEGPGSNITDRADHPVVQIAYADAVAYAEWAGKRLPTEAEWERAARGGLDGQPYVWGDTFEPDGRSMANTFQGHFPDQNTVKDGFAATAPVRSFPPNGFGLYDVAGNVWEWCTDWYCPDTFRDRKALTVNPRGPEMSLDPAEPGVAKRVTKGGSFLCTDQYCSRYMPGGRGTGEPGTATNHTGFRCVRSPVAD